MSNTIRVENLSKVIKGVTIIENINIEFESGKIYALIGRNGSGKSVFLKILTKFYKETGGRILYNDILVDSFEDFPFKVRAFLETPSFIPTMSGLDNLKILSKLSDKLSNDDLNDLFDKVNLNSERNKNFRYYSLGMKQKLGIACTLMDNPDTIILDEPFNGIDDESITMIKKLLIGMRDEGKIIIIATHIKEDIENFCDQIYSFKMQS